MKMVIELKACPFCGGKAVFKTAAPQKTNDSVGYEFLIGCYECGATVRDAKGTAFLKLQYDGSVTIANSKAVEVAAKAWNRRTEDARHNADE